MKKARRTVAHKVRHLLLIFVTYLVKNSPLRNVISATKRCPPSDPVMTFFFWST